ncbi:unnamed protein product [Chilo suppressalis]|uniref:Uncharacterized protein n=1 Tax=Chilo suppressalis TaxID=168631 RepID=A0ABN8AZW4_CHISP|nr:unnamed protein product [Chilo suppressalis]
MEKSAEPSPEPSCWKKHKDWKNRYAKLYGNKCRPNSIEENGDTEESWRRISFMTNENTPYTALLMRVRANRRDTSSSISPSPKYLTSIMSQQSDLYGTYTGTGSMLSQDDIQRLTHANSGLSHTYRSSVFDDLGGHDTLLLDMVRARSRELQEEALDQPLDLRNDEDLSEDEMSEACVHGLSMRMTERSVSRSRVSRTSTRRDMDIPSILAFTTTTAPPTHLGIPAFTKAEAPQREEIPRWSIRRSVCPVCSQKWRDKSSISNIKYSGLKRNSSVELPSVTAPARLRTAITMGYVPRPAMAAMDREAGVTNGGLRNSSATWQLTRARRFRTPRPQLPSPEATAPPTAAAPLAQRDLDIRVNRFLTDMNVKAC